LVFLQLSLGLFHTSFLDNEGKLFIVGRGHEGQLGQTVKQSLIPIEFKLNERIIDIVSGHYNNLLLTESGGIYSFGNEYVENRKLIKLVVNEKVLKIYSRFNHTIIQTENNLFGHGNGIDFQIGNLERKNFYDNCPKKINFFENRNIDQILLGFSFTCVIVNE